MLHNKFKPTVIAENLGIDTSTVYRHFHQYQTSPNFDVYLDESLKRFDFVFPAAGSENTSIKIAPDNLKEITNAAWISVSK